MHTQDYVNCDKRMHVEIAVKENSQHAVVFISKLYLRGI